jgi:hypothetical protein
MASSSEISNPRPCLGGQHAAVPDDGRLGKGSGHLRHVFDREMGDVFDYTIPEK